ncbi:GWxTD domain-containing protein [bacterium]|nr:GWxTD domain-containing protein [bacterium]
MNKVNLLGLALPALIFLVSLAIPAYAGGFDLHADWAAYKAMDYDSLIFVEFYYEFNRSSLVFLESAGINNAELSFNFKLLDPQSEIAESLSFSTTLVLPSQESKKDIYFIFDKIPLLLKPDHYKALIKLCNLSKETICDSTILYLDLGPFLDDHLRLSDIAFLSSIEPDSSASKFTKYGRKLLPNPSKTVGYYRSELYFYAEVYNLLPPSAEEEIFVVQYFVTDPGGELFRIMPQVKMLKPGTSAIIIDGIKTSDYPPGQYQLRIKAYDPASQQESITSKNFTVQDQPSNSQDTLQIKAQVSEFGQMLKFIGTSKEQQLFESLTNNGKYQYMLEFWKGRDSDPETPENEFKQDFLNRWYYAVTQFDDHKDDQVNGWESDRGRIYIKYGAPDNIERNNISLYGNEWEKWEYFNIQSGVYFIFADLFGLGQPALIHSTATGEKYDPNWIKKITNDPSNIMENLDESIYD